MDRERKTFLHSLERKLNGLRKRIPLYCHCMVLFDESIICVNLPGTVDTTFRVPVNFQDSVENNVKGIHDLLQPYFPVFTYNDRDFYIDKVDFRSNTFVVKALWMGGKWASFYQMKQPISLLLKEFQSKDKTSQEKGKLFLQSLKLNTSEEDFRVL